jgi:thiol:disulfide interchange protein
MRYILYSFTTFLFFLIFQSNTFGQILDPVSWSFSIEEKNGDEATLIFRANVDDGWYIYSQYLESEDGPIPTTFEYEQSDHVSFVGDNKESGKKTEGYDAIFGMNLVKFAGNVSFRQDIKIKDYSKPLTGYLTFMTCDDEKCLPPKDVDFSFDLSKLKKESAEPGSSGQVEQVVEPDRSAPTESEPVDMFGGSEPASIGKMDDSGILRPVTWSFETRAIDNENHEIRFTADIIDGWYVYGHIVFDGGPIPTMFEVSENPNVEITGDIRVEGKPISGFDPIFAMNITKYKETVTFVIPVSIKGSSDQVVGYLTFMTCDDEKCLPPEDVEFALTVTYDKSIPGIDISDLSLAAVGGDRIFNPNRGIDPEQYVQQCGELEVSGTGLWTVFLLGFIGGFVALLTPCVLPMIPLTVSFFTKQSKNRAQGISNAIIYGLSIIVIYVGLGMILTAMFGPEFLNWLSVHPIPNILFFLIFILFAFSFFGYYEITLPSSWVNKSDNMSDRGGLIGIFFMAFTLSLVSFSCTGPIIGTLLVEVSTGAGVDQTILGRIPMRPIIGMFGFSLALALPFALFAAFPGWLNTIPKSGGWMTNVKVTLGFLELALALKFLSVADMVSNWGLLKYELFLALWVLVFAGLAAYQFGWIKFPHDSPVKKLAPGRWVMGLVSVAAVVYLASGFNYKPLYLMSGLAPPVHYNFFRPMDCPHGLDCYKDFDEAKRVAQELNKPLLVDFTGYGCVNCRRMEEHVWPKENILRHLNENYVIASLYVDDRKRLDENEFYVDSDGNRQTLRTIGSKWAAFQVENFKQNSQPLYVLMDNDGKTLLSQPRGYMPNARDFESFLECGLDAYNQLSQRDSSIQQVRFGAAE